MTVYLDASALVALHTDTAAAAKVAEALADDGQWTSSALTLMEATALVDRLVDGPDRGVLEDLVRLTWDRLAVVPVDQRCLDRAGELMRSQPLRISDAIHLAAADRLPRPVSFVTFDPGQIPVAMAMGFEVRSA